MQYNNYDCQLRARAQKIVTTPLINQVTKRRAVLGQVVTRNLRSLLAVAIYRLSVTISVAELAVICQDREQDYRGTIRVPRPWMRRRATIRHGLLSHDFTMATNYEHAHYMIKW